MGPPGAILVCVRTSHRAPGILQAIIPFLLGTACAWIFGSPAVMTPARAGESFAIVNAHEHIESISLVPRYLEAMRRVGVARTILVGSPHAIFIEGSDGFHREEENNLEILRIAAANPDTFIAFPTVNMDDLDRVEKLKKYVAMGGRGLKLYGGSSVYHTIPLDDKALTPLFEYCQQQRIPVLLHVNAGLYLKEFEAVLDRFPRMTVICPHLCMSTVEYKRLDELLDHHPQLYTDISFGYIKQLKAGLERFSKHPERYRKLIIKHQDRVLFGTDMVITGAPEKDADWLAGVARGYRDLLEKDTYTFFALPGETLRGLRLDPAVLEKIYRTNIEKLLAVNSPALPSSAH